MGFLARLYGRQSLVLKLLAAWITKMSSQAGLGVSGFSVYRSPEFWAGALPCPALGFAAQSYGWQDAQKLP